VSLNGIYLKQKRFAQCTTNSAELIFDYFPYFPFLNW